ncbi:MAG: hypothetical protein P1U35_12865 [Cycloclasticus sp.]|nr:hypothetical protein [Cycloclasticus sp.]
MEMTEDVPFDVCNGLSATCTNDHKGKQDESSDPCLCVSAKATKAINALDEKLELIHANTKKFDVSVLPSNAQDLIALLNKKGRFKEITVSLTTEIFEIAAMDVMDHATVFEIGDENVYLKGTSFYAKDDRSKLVDLVIQLGNLS